MTITTDTSLERHPTSAFSRIRLATEIFLWRQGLLWPISAALVLTATAISIAAIWPTWQQRIAMQKQMASLDAATLSQSEHEKTSADQDRHNGRQQPNLTLEQVLPPAMQSDEDARSLYRLALKHKILFQRSDFVTTDDAQTGITRIQLAAPVTTTYPQLREFLEAFLRATPHASIDQLTFQRENVGLGEAKAKLRLSWWFRTKQASSLSDGTSAHNGNAS